MTMTKAGAAKAKRNLIKKLGGKEKYSAFMATLGAKGGRNSFGGGFAKMPREKAVAAGRKGGSVRGYKQRRKHEQEAT